MPGSESRGRTARYDGLVELARSFLALSAIALALAGCYNTRTPGLEAAGERVRQEQSSLIFRVEYEEGNFLDTEELTVWLVPSATEADRVGVWCDILIPLGAATPNTYVGGSGVSDDFVRPTDCPMPSSLPDPSEPVPSHSN